MSKEVSVIILGALIALLPYTSGLPSSWYKPLIVLFAASIVIIGIMLRREALARGGSSKGTSFFVDNRVPEALGTSQSEERERIQ